MNIASWLIVHSTLLLALCVGLFQGFMLYNYYSGYYYYYYYTTIIIIIIIIILLLLLLSDQLGK